MGEACGIRATPSLYFRHDWPAMTAFMGWAATSRIVGLGAAIAAAMLLSACSMAGLQNFRPLQGAKPVAVARVAPAPQPAPKPADAKPDAPFVALAFAAEPEAPRGGSGDINGLIAKYADYYDVPESLVHRVVKRESTYNPKARNGPYLGLMQIRHDTARSMGYQGDPAGLLDADTNLRYAVKYLRGAYIVGGYNQDAAVRNYSSGYYYDAKRQGLLKEAGLR
jgi:soluble lytic murein transglycosylase-like protein